MKNYPATVSRSLQPWGRSLATVVGQHDQPLSDADINLIQDLQDFKRAQLLKHAAPSGCLSRAPFSFRGNGPNTFVIPAFDVLFRGEVVSIQANASPNATQNRVILPPPTVGRSQQQLYIVFLELWLAVLDPATGLNYYSNGGNRYYYPFGCVNAVAPQLTRFLDDTIDPSFNEVTTERAQLQWRIAVQPVPSSYDFTAHRYGLDPDPAAAAQVFAQGPRSALSTLGFSPMASITGEATLWRAGGDDLNTLHTMDGYSYALPLAVVSRRTSDAFDPDAAPFGAAAAGGNGLRAGGLSGRWDGKFADVIGSDDVVDTRLSVSLTGYDLDPLLAQGVHDVLSGQLRTALTKSTYPAEVTGPLVPHQVGIAPAPAWRNLEALGSFADLLVGGASAGGTRNGLSSDSRTYFTTVVKTPGGGGWVANPGMIPVVAPEGTTVSSVLLQYLDSGNQVQSLLGNQVTVAGLGTASVGVTPGTYPPGSQPFLLSVGVTYPAASGVDLRKVPEGLVFGLLGDADGGSATIAPRLYGISEYEISADLPPLLSSTKRVQVYSPRFSTTTFGVRVHLALLNSTATAGDAENTFVFTLPRTQLDNRFTGLYVTQALRANGLPLVVVDRGLAAGGGNLVVVVQGPLPSGESTELVILCHETAQGAVNAAVQGLVAIEETILIGNGSLDAGGMPDLAAALDARCVIPSGNITYSGSDSIVQGYVRCGQLRAVAGDDSEGQTGLVWVMVGTSTQFAPTPCTLTLNGAAFTLKVPGTDLRSTPWFVVASFLPALSATSSLLLSFLTVPYQGEAVAGRRYAVLATAADALVTTNGTGAAPVPGSEDVFGFDRELPIATTLPGLDTWALSDLTNEALGGGSGDNYTAKRAANVEATFTTPLRTNDFVVPLQGSLHKTVVLQGPQAQGFSTLQPPMGFAIQPPLTKTALGLSTVTTAPLTLYVDNVLGDSNFNGLTPETALPTVKAALALLPPVLLHPVSILLKGNQGKPYSLAAMAQGDFAFSSTEGGIYCLGEVGFTTQGAGCLTFAPTVVPAPGVPPVTFDGSGTVDGLNFSSGSTCWAGLTPFCAFVVTRGRVIFNNLTFTAPNYLPFWGTFGAVRVERAEVEFQNCSQVTPWLGVTAFLGASVTWSDGMLQLGNNELGLLASEASLQVQHTTLAVVPGSVPAAFFSVTAGAALTLSRDNSNLAGETQETGFPTTPAYAVVVRASMGATVIATSDFYTRGRAVLNGQSVLQLQTVTGVQTAPYSGQVQFRAIDTDATCAVVGTFA